MRPARRKPECCRRRRGKQSLRSSALRALEDLTVSRASPPRATPVEYVPSAPVSSKPRKPGDFEREAVFDCSLAEKNREVVSQKCDEVSQDASKDVSRAYSACRTGSA